MNQEHRIVFQPSGRTVHVLPGTVLIEAAALAGLVLETPCGGSGTCGKCRVRVVEGNGPCSDAERRVLSEDDMASGFRLACECRVDHDLRVDIPSPSLFGAHTRILSHKQSDGHAVPADKSGWGIAFDVGTTTMIGTLVELSTGRELAVAGTINPQTSYGDDVISRIKKCMDHPDGLTTLQRAVHQGIQSLADDVLAQAGEPTQPITELVFAGNTVMQQILCGMDPSGLGALPFTPAFTDPLHQATSSLGMTMFPDSLSFVFPQIGGFVGGDTMAGLLATQFDALSGPTMFLDIGTNGELVLAHEGRFLAASLAAGPAFEGARITAGMRAAPGAIEKVMINGDVQFNVIGNDKPRGLCGTGLIDAAAELLELGVIDNMGRILGPDELGDEIPETIRRRLFIEDNQVHFTLVPAEESAAGTPLILHQHDIRELQLANGAMRAATRILLRMCKLDAMDLEQVLIAGAFGNFIRRSHAKRIGLLPDIPSERIRFVGNTASLGARQALVSDHEKERVAAMRKNIEHVDLSANIEFQQEFGAAMIFP